MDFTSRAKGAMMCCLTLATAGCATKPAANSNSGEAGKPAQPAVASANPLDDIMKAAQAQMALKSFRVRMSISLSDDKATTRLVEFVSPDRYHMVGDTDETIIVGDATYRKQAGGPWQRLPGDIGQMIAQFRGSKMMDELRKSTEVKFLGPEMLDGTPTLVYQYTSKNAMGANLTTISRCG